MHKSLKSNGLAIIGLTALLTSQTAAGFFCFSFGGSSSNHQAPRYYANQSVYPYSPVGNYGAPYRQPQYYVQHQQPPQSQWVPVVQTYSYPAPVITQPASHAIYTMTQTNNPHTTELTPPAEFQSGYVD